MMEVDRSARLANQAKLRKLSLERGAGVKLFCSHDWIEFERLAS
jgi:hypothetical protein